MNRSHVSRIFASPISGNEKMIGSPLIEYDFTSAAAAAAYDDGSCAGTSVEPLLIMALLATPQSAFSADLSSGSTRISMHSRIANDKYRGRMSLQFPMRIT